VEIRKVKGKHSERDQIIIITGGDEAILLDDVTELVYTFSLNELRRIRISSVREQIIHGEREFMFETIIKKAIEKAKREELENILKEVKKDGSD